LTTRFIRTAALTVALLLGLLATAGTVAAQDSTPATGDQPVTVGQTEVTWTGDWQYDATSSMDEQITLSQVDPATQSIKLATYGEFADDTVESPEDALDTFATAFFDGAGAEGVVEGGSGELDNGTTWKVYTFDLQGLNLAFLVTVSESADGEYVVTTLTGNADGFQDTVTQAQEQIMLNGEPTFLDGVDATAITGGLGGTPVASPEATPAS
jgi:hypothetical protein